MKTFQDIQEQIAEIGYSSTFDLKKLEMRELSFQESEKYITKNHYSHTISRSLVASLGFFYKGILVTAVVYGHPVGRNTGKFLKVPIGTFAELVRAFSKDGLPKNTESFCLGKSFKYLKENCPEIKYLITYADPNHGHVGYIYQATNWQYVGKSSKDGHPTIFIDGINAHPRSLYAKHGTSSIKELKDIYGDRLQTAKKLQKHVYLICLGTKRDRKYWYAKFEQKPYPKAN